MKKWRYRWDGTKNALSHSFIGHQQRKKKKKEGVSKYILDFEAKQKTFLSSMMMISNGEGFTQTV